MLVDFSEMFIGPDRDEKLAEHVLQTIDEQNRIEAEWLQAQGRGVMVCDLAKKREMELAHNGRS